MTGPAISPAAEQVWRLLPDYLRAADETAGGWALRAFVAAAAVGLDQAQEVLTMIDPDTSVTGTCELVNPAACPRPYLPWLGWLLGINTAALPDSDVRGAIQLAASAQRRGSIDAIRTAVQRTLTGGKDCRIYANQSGTDPYLITVITRTSETASVPTSLAAAWTEKPAGVNLTLTAVTGSTWADIAGHYATWNAVGAAFSTWNDVTAWTP